MEYGILTNGTAHKLFEDINSRPYCSECKNTREEFKEKDKKGHAIMSNLLPGFSSRKLSIPIDLLIIADAHGGGRDTDFRKQLTLEEEVENIGGYYLRSDLAKFHQKEMRELLESLDNRSWVFTDLVKCFVWQGKDNALKGSHNYRKAVKHCRKYLDEQIEVLQPKLILALGNKVIREYFNIPKLKHGAEGKHEDRVIIHSIFPSRNTADFWVKHNGWEPIKELINSNLGE